MSLKELLFAATMATSQLASGNDAPLPVQNATNHTSQKVHASLVEHGEKHALHPHVEISAGFEHDHLLDHGQVMEGDFASLGIHASLGKW